jgi:hypothetical protein
MNGAYLMEKYGCHQERSQRRKNKKTHPTIKQEKKAINRETE